MDNQDMQSTKSLGAKSEEETILYSYQWSSCGKWAAFRNAFAALQMPHQTGWETESPYVIVG